MDGEFIGKSLNESQPRSTTTTTTTTTTFVPFPISLVTLGTILPIFFSFNQNHILLLFYCHPGPDEL